jgi:hypothetical protein
MPYSRALSTRETAEYPRLLAGGDADALVAHAQLHHTPRLQLVDLEGDRPTCRTILNGVADEVAEHLFHALDRN